MKIKLNSNMVTGAIFLVISVILHVLIPSQIKTYETGSMTAATVPTLLIRILLACSVILLAQGLLSKDKKEYFISTALFQKESFKRLKPYTIPLRCFVPQKIEGLLLNGRNISGTHKAHSSYRVMPIVMNMGHAMGIVAAMCVEQNKKPLELDIHEIHEHLQRTNVTL
jgi:hypothetical protein